MKSLLFICALTFTAVQSHAQKGCNAVLIKGQKLHYTKQDVLSTKAARTISFLSAKETKPVHKKCDEIIKTEFANSEGNKYAAIFKSIE